MSTIVSNIEPRDFFIGEDCELRVLVYGKSRDGYIRALNLNTGRIENMTGVEDVLLLGQLELTDSGIIKPKGFKFAGVENE